MALCYANTLMKIQIYFFAPINITSDAIMSEVETIEPIETNLLQNLLVLTYLLIITVVIRFPYFFPAVIDWDESTQIIMGQDILDGQLPYIDLWDNKPPLSFLSYAFFILFFGKSIIAIRLAGSICVVTTAYLIYIRLKLGYFPQSISATFYDFKNLFLVTLSIVATSLLIYGYNTVDGLPLLSIGALCLFGVSAFACFQYKKVSIAHYISAILFFGFSLAAVWIDYNNWIGAILALLIGIGVFVLSNKESRIFWLETILSYCLLLLLIIH